MDLIKTQSIITGLSITLISSGCIHTFKKNDKITPFAKCQLNLGLSSSAIAGLIMIYRAIRN